MPALTIVQPPAGILYFHHCKPRLFILSCWHNDGGCRKRGGSLRLLSAWAAQGRPCQRAASLRASQTVQARAVAVQEQEQQLPLTMHPNEAWGWNDPNMLERASRQQLHLILSQLQADGEISTKQVALASDLAADLQLVRLAPDLVAAALLVVLARAEGRSMPLSAACRAVHGACGSGRYSEMLCTLVRQLEETWQASSRWQQLLGPAVSSHTLVVQQVQLLLQQLAIVGPPEVAACAPTAATAAAALAPDREAAGNLAGGLLLLASRSLAAQGQRQLSCSAVAQAIQAAGCEASTTGVGTAARRLEPVLHTLGLLSPSTSEDPVALRHKQLERLFAQLSAQGQVLPADVPVLLRLAAAMPKSSWPAGATAAALLVVLGRAHGTTVGQGAAVAVVRGAGGQIRSGISFHVKLLTQHWEANTEWQSVLGPAKDASALARERLAALVQRVSDQGALQPERLALALEMAASMPPAVLGQPHLVGGLAGALLVLLAATHGERLAKKRAETLIHAAGGEASTSGITHNLERLQEHWQISRSWRAAFGEAPEVAAWHSRPAPLQEILLRLQEAGHIQPALAPAIDHLAGRLLLRPAAHGNFVAAVLVAAADAACVQQAVLPGVSAKQQQQRHLTIRQAVAAVKAAGGSASLGRTGAMLRRLLAGWQAGDTGHQAVLGRYEVPGGSDSLPQLEQALKELCFAGVVPPSQLATALQLAGGLTLKARQPWQAGNMAAALLLVLAAAQGRRLLPAQAAEAVQRGIGAEPEAAAVHRHKLSAFKLWQSSKEWQALLGPSPLSPPPTRTTVSGLLRGLASQGALPSSQLQPALALARSLRVQQEQAGAVAGALAVGWARSSGRAGSVEGVVLALRAAGGAARAPEVEQQLRWLEERWGPPTAWAAALRHPRAAAHQQCWHVLARLLVKLEESGHLPPGKACKALHLAQSLQVWTGRGPSQRPGNVAGALLLVFARGADGRRTLTCGRAVAAVRSTGEVACDSSVTKWLARCMQQWRESSDWQDTLGPPPPGGVPGCRSGRGRSL